MSKLLLYDPERRMTAREALAHPYFKSSNPVAGAEEGIIVRNNKMNEIFKWREIFFTHLPCFNIYISSICRNRKCKDNNNYGEWTR